MSVIVPTLNEALNLPHVLPRIPRWVFETIIVDGASNDATRDVARELLPACTIVTEPRRGKGRALRTGFERARGDIIVMLDADGSTAPEEMGVFVRLLVAGADFVKGSRFLQGAGTSDMDRLRRAGNGVLTLLTRLLFGGRYSDLCYGYAAFWRRLLPVLALDADGFEIETQMNIHALRANLLIVEVPSFEETRIAGASHLSTFRDGARVLRTILSERFARRRFPAKTRPEPPRRALFRTGVEGMLGTPDPPRFGPDEELQTSRS